MTSNKNLVLGRRQFLKVSASSTAALALGFYLPLGCKSETQETDTIFIPNAYLEIHSDGRIVVIMPRSEMGQKIYTSLPQIVAEELDADWSQIQVKQGDLNPVYGSQSTGGSASIRTQYDRLRKAGATARLMLVQAAAQSWGVSADECTAESGRVLHKATDRSLPYADLAALAATLPIPEAVPLKDPREFKIIGKALKSLDGLGKVDGSIQYGYDFTLPNMLIGVIARIPKYGAALLDYDDTEALEVEGVVKIAPISSGVLVLANDTWSALEGRRKLNITWDKGPFQDLDSSVISAQLHQKLAEKGTVLKASGDLETASRLAQRRLTWTFEVPYLDHAPQEPNNCTAWIHDGICEIWAPTQNPGAGFGAAKQITQLNDEQIKIHTLRMGGGFGRKLQSDFVADAVEAAQLVSVPVKVVRMRNEDIRNGFYRPATVHSVEVGLDDNSRPVFWKHKLSGPETGWAPLITGGADELAYSIPHQHISYVMSSLPVPMGAWRSVAHTQNAFVHESAIDAMAVESGLDPLQFRKLLLQDKPRHLGVLNLVEAASGWGQELPAGHARGVAVHFSYHSYLALVIEVKRDPEKGFRLERITAAIDCGTVINPDGVRAQIEGGIIMGLTAAIYGEITIRKGAVKESNFHDYRLLKMEEIPPIETLIVPSSAAPTGAGEPPVPPTPPALTNALAALTGKRITRLPIKDQLV